MLRRLGLLSTLLIAALAATATPAFADGNAVAGMPNAVATSNGGSTVTCSASASASWFVYPEGDAGINFNGTTTCTSAVKMNGTVDLIPNGGTTPVATGSFAKVLATTGTANGAPYGTVPGSTFILRYTTTFWPPQPYSAWTWTTIPPQCTVNAGPNSLTCIISTYFTIS